MNHIDDLLGIWTRLGIKNPTVAVESEIDSFEGKFDVILPSVVREYFTRVKGTKGGKLGMDDENLFGFWHLDQVQPLSEECPDQYSTSDSSTLFVFADYSIWAFAYAMRLSKKQEGEAAVFIISGERPEQVAPGFTTFLSKYLENHEDFLVKGS